MAFKIDLSKMKKISEDQDCAVMRHDAGHEMKIAKKGLSKEMKSALEKLPIHKAQGGIANSSNQSPVLKENTKKVKRMAEGGDTSDDTSSQSQSAQQPVINVNVGQPQNQSMASPDQMADIRQSNQVDPNQLPDDFLNKKILSPAEEMQQKVDQSAADAAASAARNAALDQAAKGSTGLGANPRAALEANAAQIQSQSEQQPVDNSLSAQTDQTPANDTSNVSDQAPDTAQSVAAAQSVAKAMPAPAALAPEEVHQQVKQELTQQDQAWQNDLNNGHITPETYGDLFAKKTTLGKIGLIFGMMLSGAGSGLTHQPNALLAMMQKEIDNDLAAQTQSKANAQNFLRLNQQNQLNHAQVAGLNIDTKTKSFALAQSQMLQSSFHTLTQKVNAMPEGPAKEAAKQSLGQIYAGVRDKINNLNDQAAGAAAYNQLLFGQGGQSGQNNSDEQAFQNKANGLRLLGPVGEARAKDLEEKHIPGIKGQASVPLSSDDRAQINSGIEFDQKLHRFIDWTKKNSGNLNPKAANEGQAMAAELQGAYRQATHGGVYKEGEQNFISKIIDSDPTKFFNSIRVLPQLNAVAKENQARVNQLVKSKGFPGFTSVGSTQSSGQQAQSSASGVQEGATGTYNGKPVIFKNGKWVAK